MCIVYDDCNNNVLLVSDFTEASVLYAVLIVSASLIVLVVVVTLCGGCTPMEVGSDDHAASGGHNASDTQYSSVVTDVNSRVMSSGTTLPNDPYTPQYQGLPYDPHPQTAHRFTGYSTPPQAPTQPRLAQMPSQQSYQSGMPGANRGYQAQELPPSYNEAIQPSAPVQGQVAGRTSQPAQPYGW